MTARHTYRAWTVGETGQCYPVPCHDARTVQEAVDCCPLIHKQRIMVEHHDSVTDRFTLHLFGVKLGKRQWYATGPEARPYADPLAVIAVSAFEPVEAFQWSPGCDAVQAPAYKVISA